MKYISREIAAARGKNNSNFWLSGALHFFSFSRYALWEILREKARQNGKLSLLLPDYICHTVIDAVCRFVHEIKFYRIDRNFKVDEDDLKSKLSPGVVVIFVDYFGRECSVSESMVRELQSYSAVTIKDSAHSFLSLVGNDFKNVPRFDYTVTSIYKSLQCHVGAICFGNLPGHTDFVNPGFWIVGTLKLLTKQMLSSGGWTHLINRGIESLLEKDTDQISSPSAGLNCTKMLRRFLATVDWQCLVDRQKKLSMIFWDFWNDWGGASPIFSKEDCESSSLTVFPIMFSSKAERDRLFFSLRKFGVDCYTWPVFPKICQRIDLWEGLLLIPVKEEVLGIVRGMENV